METLYLKHLCLMHYKGIHHIHYNASYLYKYPVPEWLFVMCFNALYFTQCIIRRHDQCIKDLLQCVIYKGFIL